MKNTKKQHIKSAFSTKLVASSALAAGVLGVAMSAQAAPVLDHVVAGGVSVDNTSGIGNVVVTQTTNQGVVNWQNFNIGKTESTQFVQPSANSVTLNRVTGDSNPSQILGSLTANGKVAIVNPNGVVFGRDSKVDVAGLVATTADIDSDAFMTGGTSFNKAGAAGATVDNQGSITAKDGGLVALVAPNVKNSGVITARKGTVILGGAQGASLDLYGDGLVNFAITGESGGNNAVEVTSSGKVIADAGHVYIAANQASSVVDNVINMQGYVQANSVTEGTDGVVIGSVHVDSGEGNTLITGKINASGGASGVGGNVVLRGHDIKVQATDDKAYINVRGGKQGGTIDAQASNLLEIGQAAPAVVTGSGVEAARVIETPTANVLLDASSTGEGARGGRVTLKSSNEDGLGAVKVWSNGTLDASGTSKGGDIEVSGDHLVFSGGVDARGAEGGTVVFDPKKIRITDGAASGKLDTLAEETIEGISKSGANVVVAAQDEIQVNNLTDNKLRGGDGDITLKTTSDAGKISFNSKKDTISTQKGDVTVSAASGGVYIGNITTESGNINVSTVNGGDISTGRLSVTHGVGAATIKADAAGSLHVKDVSIKVADGKGESAAVLKAGKDITVDHNVSVVVKGTADATEGHVEYLRAADSVGGGEDSVGGSVDPVTGDIAAVVDIHAGGSVKVGNDLEATVDTDGSQSISSAIRVHAADELDIDHTHAHAFGGSDATAQVTLDATTLDIRDDVESYSKNATNDAAHQFGSIDIAGQVTAYIKDFVTDFEATNDVHVVGNIHAVSTSDKDVGATHAVNAHQALRLVAGDVVTVAGDISSLLADIVVRAGAGGIDVGNISTGQDISGLVFGQEEGAFEAGSIHLYTTKGSAGDIKAGDLTLTGTMGKGEVKVTTDGNIDVGGIDAQVLDFPDPGSQTTLDVIVRAGKNVDIHGDVVAKSLDNQGATRRAENTVTIEAGKALTIDGDVITQATGGHRHLRETDSGWSSTRVALTAGEALTVGDVLVKALGGDTSKARADIVSGGTVSVGDVRVEASTTEGLEAASADAYLSIVAAGTDVEDDSKITYTGATPYAAANSTTLTSRYDAVNVAGNDRAEISIVKLGSSSGGSSSGGSSSGGSSSGGSSSGGSSSGGSSSGGSSSGGSSSGGTSSGGAVNPTLTISPLALDELAALRDSSFSKDRYSFFGETMGKPYYFGNTDVNLTLLSGKRAAPTTPATNLSPEALGGIAPAAGGAAASGEGDCGNNYLDNGFSTGFNDETCREDVL